MTINEQRSFLIGLSCRGLLRGARRKLPLAGATVRRPVSADTAINFAASRHNR